jgi:hypothetical protein
MTKREIQDQLLSRHQSFIATLDALSAEEFERQPGTAWTAGQQWAHILSSVKPVAMAFALPKIVLRLWLGKNKRPPRDYAGLVERYLGKIAAGGRATGRFVPPPILLADKPRLRQDLEKAVSRLVRRIDRFSEKELDALLLPHPLLGKVTYREMLFFTLHHVDHHAEITRRNLGAH